MPSPFLLLRRIAKGTGEMAKVTARVSVRGMDLKEMMGSALDQLGELSDAKWAITEVDLYAFEDIATRDGMSALWNAQMTATADV